MNRTLLRTALLLVSVSLLPLPSTSANAAEAGKPAPQFSTKNLDGAEVSLSNFKGKTVVLEWFNYGCPFVRKHYTAKAMQGLQKEFVDQGVIWLTINSTSPTHRDYKDIEASKVVATEVAMASTHIIADPGGAIGKLYDAKTTPHMFIIDPAGSVVYQGAIDDNPELEGKPSEAKNYVRDALKAQLSGAPIPTAQTKPYGCSVKY